MGFAENLQYLRRRDKLTQEELADCLGVSRQSVSKWETGEAYPETDKLILLCDRFDVSIDELLRGDVTRDVPDRNVPERDTAAADKVKDDGDDPDKVYPDEWGFLPHMDVFSRNIALGVFLIMVGVALCVGLSALSAFTGSTVATVLGACCVLLFAAAAVFLFVWSGIKHDSFTSKHRKLKNMVSRDETDKFLKKFITATASLISAILVDVVLLIVVCTLIDSGAIGSGWSDKQKDGAMSVTVAVFLVLLGAVVSGLTYFGLQRQKYLIGEYNRENAKSKHVNDAVADAVCGAIMLTATGIFLLLGFVWSLWHPGWVVFPIGGILCGICGNLLKLRRGGKGDEDDKD